MTTNLKEAGSSTLNTEAEARAHLEQAGCRFEPSPFTDLQTWNLDDATILNVFSKNGPDLAREILNYFQVFADFVQKPIIIDPFPAGRVGAAARRAWRTALPEEVRVYLEDQSKLRKNNITKVISGIKFLAAFIDESIYPQIKAQLVTMHDALMDEYFWGKAGRDEFFIPQQNRPASQPKPVAYENEPAYDLDKKKDFARRIDRNIISILRMFTKS